ncbi:helix-turn-helix transcriptional regulator [Planomonospora corallina]|uniref:Helix-turn-helix transcriptional regulator n=1 Tax=Planomonospora corallina TaxID=1806052 RepID=A0ABV8IFA6_9ACTN
MDEQPNPHTRWEANFIQQMRLLREARKMTQSDLARELKKFGLAFHQQTVQRIEIGERPVRLNEAHLIASIFDVDVETMSSALSLTDREIRYGIDRLRARSTTHAADLSDTLAAWISDVEAFTRVLAGRLPPGATAATDLDPVTRWGMAWAMKALTTYEAFLELWRRLTDLGGQTLPPYLDNDPALLPTAPDVLSLLYSWRDAFGDAHLLALADTDDLYEHVPDDETSD